jgi:hypothetical protein
MKKFLSKNVIKFFVSLVFMFTLYSFFIFYYKLFENNQITYFWALMVFPCMGVLALCLKYLLDL